MRKIAIWNESFALTQGMDCKMEVVGRREVIADGVNWREVLELVAVAETVEMANNEKSNYVVLVF